MSYPAEVNDAIVVIRDAFTRAVASLQPVRTSRFIPRGEGYLINFDQLRIGGPTGTDDWWTVYNTEDWAEAQARTQEALHERHEQPDSPGAVTDPDGA